MSPEQLPALPPSSIDSRTAQEEGASREVISGVMKSSSSNSTAFGSNSCNNVMTMTMNHPPQQQQYYPRPPLYSPASSRSMGRGRNRTLPAWMTQQQTQMQSQFISVDPQQNQQYDDMPGDLSTPPLANNTLKSSDNDDPSNPSAPQELQQEEQLQERSGVVLEEEKATMEVIDTEQNEPSCMQSSLRLPQQQQPVVPLAAASLPLVTRTTVGTTPVQRRLASFQTSFPPPGRWLGRGRSQTLPAWMTADPNHDVQLSLLPPPPSESSLKSGAPSFLAATTTSCSSTETLPVDHIKAMGVAAARSKNALDDTSSHSQLEQHHATTSNDTPPLAAIKTGNDDPCLQYSSPPQEKQQKQLPSIAEDPLKNGSELQVAAVTTPTQTHQPSASVLSSSLSALSLQQELPQLAVPPTAQQLPSLVVTNSNGQQGDPQHPSFHTNSPPGRSLGRGRNHTLPAWFTSSSSSDPNRHVRPPAGEHAAAQALLSLRHAQHGAAALTFSTVATSSENPLHGPAGVNAMVQQALQPLAPQHHARLQWENPGSEAGVVVTTATGKRQARRKRQRGNKKSNKKPRLQRKKNNQLVEHKGHEQVQHIRNVCDELECHLAASPLAAGATTDADDATAVPDTSSSSSSSPSFVAIYNCLRALKGWSMKKKVMEGLSKDDRDRLTRLISQASRILTLQQHGGSSSSSSIGITSALHRHGRKGQGDGNQDWPKILHPVVDRLEQLMGNAKTETDSSAVFDNGFPWEELVRFVYTVGSIKRKIMKQFKAGEKKRIRSLLKRAEQLIDAQNKCPALSPSTTVTAATQTSLQPLQQQALPRSMGRGRNQTLPAWMTRTAQLSESNHPPPSPSNGLSSRNVKRDASVPTVFNDPEMNGFQKKARLSSDKQPTILSDDTENQVSQQLQDQVQVQQGDLVKLSENQDSTCLHTQTAADGGWGTKLRLSF